MSTSPLSNPQRPKLGLINRWLWSKPVTRQLAIIAGLTIFALGCADFASQTAYLASIQGNEANSAQTTASNEAEEPDFQQNQAGPVPEITVVALNDELLVSLAQGASPAAGIALPALESATAPGSTPTQVIVATPAFSSTPSLIAISEPTTADTPPPSAPTPASLPGTVVTPAPHLTRASGINHVVIISIDGLRPDALDLADTPALTQGP